jgi:predicted Zn-dependent protease
MAKVFSTHPLNASRIKAAQKDIQEILPSKPEYVVTTSEFNDVKARLMALHNHRRVDVTNANRPTLRRAPGSGGGPVADDTRGKDSGKSTGDDDRPTLKRR